jgi:hypothetical protein
MAVRETVDVKINNIIYMELYSGAKIANGKYRKTYVTGSVDRENTVFQHTKSSLAEVHYIKRAYLF